MNIFGIRIMRERTYRAEREAAERLLAVAERQVERHRENQNFWMRESQAYQRELVVNKHWPHNNRITVRPRLGGGADIEVTRS